MNSTIPTATNLGRGWCLGNAIVAVVIVIIVVGVLSQCDGCKEGEDDLGDMHSDKDDRRCLKMSDNVRELLI